MVQKEIKKKTSVYGLVAVLSAIVLVSLVYSFGALPIVYPPTQVPMVNGMRAFSNVQEIIDYLNVNSQGTGYYGGGPLDAKFFGESTTIGRTTVAPTVADAWARPEGAGAYTLSSDQYSTTNIQVAGVDEADTVKTDGQYIYAISTQSSGYYLLDIYPPITSGNDENAVYILNADPQNAKVVSKIVLANNTQPAGLFLSQDGTRLVVLASKYEIIGYDTEGAYRTMLLPFQSNVYTYVNVYDVSNKANPVLTRNFTATGSYFNSRMIGDNVYTVVSQPANVYNGAVTLPAVYQDKRAFDASPASIYYADMAPDAYCTFTSFYGLNVKDDAKPATNMTVLMGGASTMYVSPDNFYVTYPLWTDSGQYTSIYRVRINGLDFAFEAEGSVPGYVLNQYSMDQYNGYFRIAVTWQKQTSMNNVYVLNMNLNITGRLENLAEGESIYAARFMGNKAYIVTFRQIDPFFIIDLSDPANPKVSGELKIPGYSSYLHPYDENHVIGLGKENSTVKLSLFDVSNPNAPKEVAKYIVEGDYTDSQALYEPKAFLFSLQKQLLVIPVSITQYGYVPSEPNRGDTATKSTDAYSQGSYWQGAYVFKLTPNGGFELKGEVTHQENGTNPQGFYYGYDGDSYINRALYIGNTLYTVSNTQVKLSSLSNLAPITTVKLS